MNANPTREKIAIVGLGALFPGATTPGQFWDNLVAGHSAISQASAADFGADPALFYAAEKGALDRAYSLRGGFIRDFAFDAHGYLLPAGVLQQQDQQYQWCLYVAREALRDSGYWQQAAALQRCGVIVGNLSFPTRASRQLLAPLYAGAARHALSELAGQPVPVLASQTDHPVALADTLLAGAPSALVAQALGLGGPHYALDAACASSLYAVKLACDVLRAGQADLMLAGAVSGADPLLIHIGFSYFHAYPQAGEPSQPLDQHSNGLTSAEGAGMVVLKRLADAQRNGDVIHAIIEDVGLSNDGKGEFLLTPNPKGQHLAFERAYAHAGFGPAALDYLECHATGTRLGDKVELNSISQFFGAAGSSLPRLGSVKSNVGHLLTAAGMASLLKVVLAMRHQLLPATVGVAAPLASADGRVGAAQLVRTNQPWTSQEATLRAGINAFGFGGTNAHLLLTSSAGAAAEPATAAARLAEPLAIVGMGVHLGSCTSLEEYYLSVLLGRQHFQPLPPDRWKGLDDLRDTLADMGLPDPTTLRGAWVEGFTIDLLRFKIQPKEAQRTTPQQLLMLHVADQAIRDAGLAERAGKGANIAVIIAMETELEIHHRLGRWHLGWQVPGALDEVGLALEASAAQTLTGALKNAVFSDHEHHSPSEHTGFIGNIIASRIAALLDFTGPAFTVSSGENGVYRALEIARNLLASGEVEAVVLGAIDLGGGLESVLARHAAHPVQAQPGTMSWNQGTTGWAIGEGAGAIVLKRAADATADRVYAQLDSLAVVQAAPASLRGTPTAAAVAEAARQALAQPGLEAAAIGLLEVSGSGIAAEDAAEMAGLAEVYQGPAGALTCALGSSKAHVGHTYAAAGLAAIIKSALALYYRFLPGMPGWQGPASAAALVGSRFYVPALSRPWLPDAAQPTLRAAVSSLAADGTSAHLLLSAGGHPVASQPAPYLLRGGERLFPLRAASVEGLAAQLTELEAQLPTGSYTQVADQLCAAFENLPASETLVLVAASGAELGREIRFFRQQLAAGLAPGASLQTPAGSFYTTRPLGAAGKLALVYPGSGSPYLGLGATLLQAFPALYDELGTQGFDPAVALNGPLYPRHLFAPDPAQQLAQEQAFQADAMAMVLIGCTFAGLYTRLVQQALGVRADAVLGYSMGETSAMWYSQQLWSTAQVNEKFLQAPLFWEKIGGRLTLLADVWQLPEAEARARWSTRLLHLPAGRPGYASLAAWFRAEVQPRAQRVYLSFINTDTEIVLSGDGMELDALLTHWQLPNVPLTLNNAAHHDFCRQVTPDILAMHHQPIQGVPDKVYYSSVRAAPLPVTAEALAHNALEVCCQPVDWPRLVRQVAADGYSLFLEIGPGATCSRWIQELLPGPDYAALPLDRKGASVLRSLTGLVARLLAHGVPVNLAPFYEFAPAGPPPRKTLRQTLHTGGPRLADLVLTPANYQLLAAALRRPAVAVDVLAPVAVALPAAGALPVSPQQAFAVASLMEMELTTTVAPVAENGLALQDYTSPLHLQGKPIIWDEADLLTFATGRIQDVFGPAYAPIDAYPRRVMLPMPPYLLVSRVTHLDAALHEYQPSRLTTEYDIPYDSAFATDGQIPWAVAVESGQCDLLLISYLGVDFQNQGEYVYRLLDCTLTFTDDLPFEGQTLRYDIAIDRFVRSGDNLLFFFHYRCYVADRLVLKMDGGCAGFFSRADLALGQGVVFSAAELRERAGRPRQFFAPLLECAKIAFSRADLLALVRGDVAACFGDAYQPLGRNPSLRLPPPEILLLDRITRVDRQGGSAGLGYLEAEKDLHPDDWYFPCHFRDDEVLAGSLQAEGGGQLLRFYLLLLGMQRLTKDARFQPVLDRPQKVRCRREVPARAGKLVYQLDVKEIGLVPQPYVVADLAIVYEGQVAVYFENLGLRLQEKSAPAYLAGQLPRQQGVYVKPTAQPVLFSEYHITQMALGPVHRCFGDEYRGFEGRPLSRQPNTDLQLISRVLSSTGTRLVFNNKPVLVSEYDVPADAWYFVQNAAPEMPYSILMEIALQPCGFLGAYLGTTLLYPDKDLFLRNLDGDGDLLRAVDLCGQTITNRVCLLSHTALNGTVLQRYTYELAVAGEPFYRGTASFGCFTRDDLTNQVGLDRGTHVASWYETAQPAGGLSFKLDSLFGRRKLYQAPDPAAPQLHLAGGQLNLLDTALVVPGGGRYGQGYVFARRAIEVHNWFFTCHFYQDPVMPGSLGVEAMFQALQVFALQQNLAAGLPGATFQPLAPHQTKWKYRGQLQTTDPEMSLEVHLKTSERTADTLTLVADASLWKGPLRIYEVTDLGLVIK